MSKDLDEQPDSEAVGGGSNVRAILGSPDDWMSKRAELEQWTGSAWIAGEGAEDLRGECYSFLCGLIGYLMAGEDAAKALAERSTRGDGDREVLEEVIHRAIVRWSNGDQPKPIKAMVADAILALPAESAVAGEPAIPADVVRLVVAAREVLDADIPMRGTAGPLMEAVEAFASRVCYDDDGGDIPEAHAVPCTCRSDIDVPLSVAKSASEKMNAWVGRALSQSRPAESANCPVGGEATPEREC